MAPRSELSLANLLIREIRFTDAAAAAALSEELGYPVPPEIMRQRLDSLARSSDQVVYVASLSAKVVGWIHVLETRHLTVEPRAEIGGLVVASAVRGAGIGHRLVVHAEDWARQRGLKSVLVRSRDVREGAHRFYLREGYARTKTSAVFTKQIAQKEDITA